MNTKIKKIDLNKINIEVKELRKNLLNLRFQKSTGQLEKTSQIKITRRKIARIKTEISKNKGSINA